MRAYVQLSGVLFALVALGHLVRVLARWPLLIAGYPLPALASLVVLVVTGGMSVWAWRLLTGPQGTTESASKRPPAA
jgi:hypothetical protein